MFVTRALPIALLGILAFADPDAAGAVTVTGTDKHDEIEIVTGAEATRVTGAATVTGTGCVQVTDPRAGRPAGVECPRISAWDIGLGGGDDSLAMSAVIPGPSRTTSISIDAGAGNDTMTVLADQAFGVLARDGDDTLATVLPLDPQDTGGVSSIDMGTGRDLLDYSGAPFGVTVDLLSDPTNGLGVARMQKGPDTRNPDTGQPQNTTGTQTQVVSNTERVLGSPGSDLLSGTPKSDELLGGGGVDTIRGLEGDDIVNGGPGADTVDGGEGADVVVGGGGIDDFPIPKAGGDSYDARDGLAERLNCLKGDTVVDDLVDELKSSDLCSSIQTAAAKHHFDTVLSSGPLSIDAGRVLAVRVACPSLKTEACAGTLRLRRGSTIASAPYRVPRGRSIRLRFTPTRAGAKRLRGRVATLEATEVDADKRARLVVRRVSVRR